MNVPKMAALAACCAVPLLAGTVCAQALFQPPAKSPGITSEPPPGRSPVWESCKADAGKLEGASLDTFMLECRIQRTSLEDKTQACERNMADSVSKRVARDPESRAKFIADCVQRWTPSIK